MEYTHQAGTAAIRARALDLIHQHLSAAQVVTAALAEVDRSYILAVDLRTQDDHQVLRDAEQRLGLLLGGEGESNG